MDKIAAELIAKNLQNKKDIWEELPPEAIEKEEELLTKRLLAARQATKQKLDEMLKELKETERKIKPTRTLKERQAKRKALVTMGIPAKFPMDRAGTKLGMRVLEDAAARCMHESLKAGDYLGDAYLFKERAAVEPEKRARWQIKIIKKGEALEKLRSRLYDMCGVPLPEKPLTHRNYEEYDKQLKERYKKKVNDLKRVRKLTRSKFYYESVPKCGLNAVELAQKIGEIQSLILAGKPGYPPFPDKLMREAILDEIETKKGRKVTLESILHRLEHDSCVCGDFAYKNASLIKEIKKKISEGDMTVLEDLEELKDRLETCLNRKMLPVKVPLPAKKAEEMPMEIVITSRVMTDMINKWGAEEAAEEFHTDRKIMEILANGFGKTFETV